MNFIHWLRTAPRHELADFAWNVGLCVAYLTVCFFLFFLAWSTK